MMKRNLSLITLFVLAAALFAAFPTVVFCGQVPAQAAGEALIRGQDCQTLRDFFARFDQDKTNKVPSEEVKRILLQALPGAYKRAWADTMGAGTGIDGPAGMTVRVLHVEGRKEEKPIRALVTFTVLPRGEATAAFYDEQLATLVVRRDTARLSVMERAKDFEGLQFVHILQEKEVHIGGKGVIGLNFAGSNESALDSGPVTRLKEERVNFYVFQDNGIKPAGSVLKGREERLREGTAVSRSVYSGTIVFKKDMKGNIIGILAPYTVTTDGRRTEKGMVRYAWDTEKETFVKE